MEPVVPLLREKGFKPDYVNCDEYYGNVYKLNDEHFAIIGYRKQGNESIPMTEIRSQFTSDVLTKQNEIMKFIRNL